MPIPDFQSIMLPLLESVKDGKEYTPKENAEEMGKFFKLTDDELNERLPKSNQFTFNNRVAWAKSYLKMASLVKFPKKGLLTITKLGLKVLEEKPEKINIKYLTKFKEFNEKRFGKEKQKEDKEIIEVSNKTPVEEIEFGYQILRNKLIADLKQKLKEISPSDFEKLVVDLLVNMGYGGTIEDAGEVLGKSGDEGVDGIIKEDKLGLDNIYIQAKRWENVVSRPEIQKFVGALAGKQARKGVFIITSHFSKSAYEYVEKIENKVILIDGNQLAQLMIDHNIGVSIADSYEIKKIDTDYFEDI